ncbi:DoxX family protein [Mucilaginibacter sp. RS28]|uniref:DoxX family protein n=1 Tax=Mucilaginibacter straminoryzae TaxID=2932774 RepID=A0A9X1WZ85_9SPHI|nr:DoxX family protein [Mucilaginibacter straminoryzae]MCJ8208372.1 DoxX family protein [Mucilaginibacter straminoryzae]
MTINQIIHLLLFSDAGSRINNWALLFFRVFIGFELFRVHGLKKFKVENGQREHVPNPLGLPDKLNGLIATFSDTVVPFLLMLGVATRLILLPVMGVTSIGYFVVHRHDSVEVRDVPYMYTLCFLFLLIIGPGTVSIDHYLLNQFFTL